MQGLAKQSRYIMFTKAQLITFGNYLLSHYDTQAQCTDADFANWKELNPTPYTVGQPVWLCLWSHKVIAEVLCVHSYEEKVKYDLSLVGEDGDTTRIYNVDSFYVKDKVQQ